MQLVTRLVIKLLVKLLKFHKIHKKNNSETVTNENDKEILKEKYVSTEERQKIIDDLKLI